MRPDDITPEEEDAAEAASLNALVKEQRIHKALAAQNAMRDERLLAAERDLIARLLRGWGSDEAGCVPENYAAYEEARALLGLDDDE